jgi:hypothetical protein
VALGASFVVNLITIRRFRSSAPKAQNGFVAAQFVSSLARGMKQRKSSHVISMTYQAIPKD